VEWYQSPKRTTNSFSISPSLVSAASAAVVEVFCAAVLGGLIIRGPKMPSTAERPVWEWYLV
jgi:hypothetical protein